MLRVETLLIALRFTTHVWAIHQSAARRVVKKIKAEGLIEDEKHPLLLPRHSIRFLLIAAFVGLGAYLLPEGRLLEPRAVPLPGIVAAYIGCLVRGIAAWFGGRRKTPPSTLWATCEL